MYLMSSKAHDYLRIQNPLFFSPSSKIFISFFLPFSLQTASRDPHIHVSFMSYLSFGYLPHLRIYENISLLIDVLCPLDGVGGKCHWEVG